MATRSPAARSRSRSRGGSAGAWSQAKRDPAGLDQPRGRRPVSGLRRTRRSGARRSPAERLRGARCRRRPAGPRGARAGSPGGPRAIGRPSAPRASTRSASGQTRSARCSTSTMRRRAGRAHRREPGRQLADPVGVEVRRRLVEDQDPGGRRERPGDREALLLAARESCGAAPLEAGEAERRRAPPGRVRASPGPASRGSRGRTQPRRPRAPSRAGSPGPGRRSRPAGRSAPAGSRPATMPTHHELAVEAPRDRARHEPRDRPGQGALARPGRPDDQEAAARGKVERDVGDRRGRGALVGDADVAGADRARRTRCVAASADRARRSAWEALQDPGPAKRPGEHERAEADDDDRGDAHRGTHQQLGLDRDGRVVDDPVVDPGGRRGGQRRDREDRAAPRPGRA